MSTNVKNGKSDTSADASAYTSRVDAITASARELASQVESGSTRLVDRVPDAVESARAGAMDAARTVDAMPEQTRLVLAALSLGVGAGLYLAGAPRLVTVLAFAPAAVVAGTWMAREPMRSTTD
jgi:hypothetical protein